MTLLSFLLFSYFSSPALGWVRPHARRYAAGREGGQMWSSAAAADSHPHPRRLRSRPSMAAAATCASRASPPQLHGPTGHHRTCLTFPGTWLLAIQFLRDSSVLWNCAIWHQGDVMPSSVWHHSWAALCVCPLWLNLVLCTARIQNFTFCSQGTFRLQHLFTWCICCFLSLYVSIICPLIVCILWVRLFILCLCFCLPFAKYLVQCIGCDWGVRTSVGWSISFRRSVDGQFSDAS